MSSSRAPHGSEGAGGVNGVNGDHARGGLPGLPWHDPDPKRRPGIALAIMLSAQLMIILDVCSLLVIITFIRSRGLTPASAPAPRRQEEAIAS